MKFINRLSVPFVFVVIFSILGGTVPQTIHANAFSTNTMAAKAFSSAHQLNDSDIVPGQVIVKYKNSMRSSSSFGIKTIESHTQVLQFSKDISVSDKIAELEKDPNVEYAEPDYKVHLTVLPTQTQSASLSTTDGSITNNVYFSNDTNYMHYWGQTVTKLTYAKGLTYTELSKKVVVAVLDTGVYMDHPDLIGAKISGLAGKNFVDKDNDPQDDNGHGTNVAGIIAANGTFSGVAPGTKILPVKVLDNKGDGNVSLVIAGINYAVENKVDIINLSLASNKDSQSLHEAIINAVNAGVLVVAAAGNAGNNYYGGAGDISNAPFFKGKKYAAETEFPAAYPEVISVGALEQLPHGSIAIADFSNVGKIDVVAPGVNIYSTYKDPEFPYTRNYIYMSGTSQATPLIVGFAALLKANNGDLDVARLTAIIKNSARPFGEASSVYPDRTLSSYDIYGNGLIDGETSFQKPRLDFTSSSEFDYYNKLTLEVSARDYHGKIVLSESKKVYASLYQVLEDEESDILHSQLAVNLVNGFGRIDLPNPTPQSKFYHYLLHVDEGSSGEQYIAPRDIELVYRPWYPLPNQGGGLYLDPLSISLQNMNTTENATMYYRLNDGSILPYVGPFIISENSSLKTFAVINHVVSSNSLEWIYTFSKPNITNNQPTAPLPFVPGPPGLPGPIESVTPTPLPSVTPTPKPAEFLITKVDDGKSSLEVKPNKDFLIDLLNKSKEAVIIDAKSTQSLYTVSVDLDGNVMQKAKEKGTPIIIQSNDLQIHFAPDTLNLGSSTASVKFSATVADNQALPANTQAVSTIYDFNLSVDSVSTHTFNNPIEVHFSIDPAKVHTLNNLGVFYYNDSTQKWEYVGGTVSKDNTVTALLPHFSKYAVLENSKTFADIQNHWAKNEIEEMAAKQIINGMTEDSFKPEANITRAQFVSLLSRSLKLESPVDSIGFSDVPVNAWYKYDVYSAFNNQIVKGITEHTFAPEDKITREQLATLLVNAYLQKTGKQLSDIVTTQEVKYGDEGGISSWARANVRIATSLGLMSGSGNEKFNPKGLATRAEAAVVLERFLNKIK